MTSCAHTNILVLQIMPLIEFSVNCICRRRPIKTVIVFSTMGMGQKQGRLGRQYKNLNKLSNKQISSFLREFTDRQDAQTFVKGDCE